jgi:hypothetical protein
VGLGGGSLPGPPADAGPANLVRRP